MSCFAARGAPRWPNTFTYNYEEKGASMREVRDTSDAKVNISLRTRVRSLSAPMHCNNIVGHDHGDHWHLRRHVVECLPPGCIECGVVPLLWRACLHIPFNVVCHQSGCPPLRRAQLPGSRIGTVLVHARRDLLANRGVR